MGTGVDTGVGTGTGVGTDCTYAEWSASGQDVHSLVGVDPMFRDADHRVFALDPQSPALALGITSIDVSGVGPLPR